MAEYRKPTAREYIILNGGNPDGCQTCYDTGRLIVAGRTVYCPDCEIGAALSLQNTKRILARADIPPRYEHASLADFLPLEGLDPAKHDAVTFASAYVAGGASGWVCFYGPYGGGKTHLGVACLNDLMQRGTPCRFARWGDVIDSVKASYDDETITSKAVMERYSRIRMLMIDELTTEKMTPHTASVLETILRNRYNALLPTIFTTNVKPSELLDALGERIATILGSETAWKKIAGASYRDYGGIPE